MFALSNEIKLIIQIRDVFAHSPRGNLPVQYLTGNIAIIGRHLTPALMAVFGGNADKADILGTEGLY